MNNQRKVIEYLEKNPFADVALEIFSIVLFAIMPIFLAAFASVMMLPTFEAKTYFATLYRFFSDGEFVLLTIGLCGSIFWLGLVKLTKVEDYKKFIFIYVPIVILAFPTSILILHVIRVSAGKMPGWLVWFTLCSYVLCLVIYFWALYQEKTQDRPPPNNDAQKADDILSEAGKRSRNSP